MIFFVTNPRNSLSRIKFYSNNTEIHFVVDSGASCSLLSHDLLPAYAKIDKKDIIRIRGISGYIYSLGSIHILLRYENSEFLTKFHVVNNLPPHVPGLLSTDFLRKHSAKLDYEINEIISTDNNSHIIIPARTEIITYVRTSQENERLILNREIAHHVYTANSIVSVKDGKIPVRILNMRNKPVTINNLKIETKSLNDYNVIKIKTQRHDSERVNKLFNELKLDHLANDEKKTIAEICKKYNDIFCLKDDNLTTTKMYQASINVKNNTNPVYVKQYRLSISQRQEIDNQISKMMKEGTIEEAKSEWNSPLLLVPKKSTNDSRKW